MRFYDQLAELYDEMIDFDQHLNTDLQIYQRLMERYPAEHILDAGCGTGLHSLIFTRLGARVTAIDNSAEMIARARENASRCKADVQFFQTDFLNFTDLVRGRFDAVYCMGNSFVHLPTKQDRLQVFANFYRVMKHNGILCLQILNYDKILIEKPSIISQKKRPPYQFIRKYDYQRHKIIFTLEIRGLSEPLFLIQDIFPLKSEDLIYLAQETGFNQIDLTGSLSMEPYDPGISQNICAWMRRD